jgi:subtilisin family serine protease
VQVGRFSFDPIADGEPALPDDLKAHGSGPGLRLLQLAGVPGEPCLSGLEASGLKLLQYMPYNTYLVWAAGIQLEPELAARCVRWHGAVHPGYKISLRLVGRSGQLRNLDITVIDDGQLEATLTDLESHCERVIQHFPAQPDGALVDVIARCPADSITSISRLPSVLWVGASGGRSVLGGEMSSAVAGGLYEDGEPLLGYRDHLASLGYDGSGVIWAVTDSGVDMQHPDLPMIAGINYPGCETDEPGDDLGFYPHGTPVASMLAGTAAIGYADGDGFLYGLGVAPGASLVSLNAVCSEATSWPPDGGWERLSRDGLAAGAVGTNNSWNSLEDIPHGYQATERTHDFMVRDGDFGSNGIAEPYIIVFCAGNNGPEAQTMDAPTEAKNVIVVGATQNRREDGDIDTMADYSSRGPAVDGRLIPTVVAPGHAPRPIMPALY